MGNLGVNQIFSFISKKLAIPGELPKQDTSTIEAGLPKTMLLAFGDGGIKKDRRLYNDWNYVITAKEKYALRRRHGYFAAAMNAICKQIKKAEIEVAPIDETKPFNEKAKAKMEEFIKSGFGEFGEKEFRARMVDTKKWNGDSWAEIIFDSTTNEPIFVNYLLAETMNVLPNESGQIIGYPQIIDGQANFTFPPANIIHMMEHQDEYSFFGYSDIDALFTALVLDILADENSIALLKNDSMPGGMAIFNDDIGEDDLARLRWNVIIQLRQNPGQMLFLNKIKQYIPPTNTARDINWVELRKTVRDKIFSVCGVLPMQAAIVETGRLANPEQQLEIGEEYIRQELEIIEAFYNMKLTPFFKDSQNLKFKFKDIQPKLDALKKEADIFAVWANSAKTLSAIPGVFTINEIRELVDYEEIDGGDQMIQQPQQQQTFGLSANPKTKAIKPFGGYEDFNACLEANQGKDNPQAYCAEIMRQTESPDLINIKAIKSNDRKKFELELNKAYAKAAKAAIKKAKETYPKAKEKSISKKSIGEFDKEISAIFSALGLNLKSIVQVNAARIFLSAKKGIWAEETPNDSNAIEQLLTANGVLDAVKQFTKEEQEGFVKVMQNSFEEGLDLRSMVKEMRKYADVETYRLERIARTETNRFANQGRFAGYDELERERGEKYLYDWIGPDDERTSEICSEIKSGNSYSLDEIMKITDGGEPHPNCRHNVVRSFK